MVDGEGEGSTRSANSFWEFGERRDSRKQDVDPQIMDRLGSVDEFVSRSVRQLGTVFMTACMSLPLSNTLVGSAYASAPPSSLPLSWDGPSVGLRRFIAGEQLGIMTADDTGGEFSEIRLYNAKLDVTENRRLAVDANDSKSASAPFTTQHFHKMRPASSVSKSDYKVRMRSARRRSATKGRHRRRSNRGSRHEGGSGTKGRGHRKEHRRGGSRDKRHGGSRGRGRARKHERRRKAAPSGDGLVVDRIDDSEIVKPKWERRKFRLLRLKNGLRLLLASDPKVQQAYVAVNVGSGSSMNPKDVPGMAHFVEHMLFCGSEKFPDVNDYEEYVHNGAGEVNGVTSLEATNHQFYINTRKLEGALDRMASHFVAPKFSRGAVDQEIQMIQMEFEDNKAGFGAAAVVQATLNPKHSSSQFSAGNAESLNVPELAKKGKKWFEKNYSADLMGCFIYSNQSLDELEKMAVKHFARVKEINYDMADVVPPYEKHRLPLQIYEQWKNGAIFAFPQQHGKGTEADTYVDDILSSEHAGGLMDSINQLPGVTKAEWSEDESYDGFDFRRLRVNFESDPSDQDITTVGNRIFSFINKLKQSKVPNWLVKDTWAARKIKFFHKEDESEIEEYVQELSSGLVGLEDGKYCLGAPDKKDFKPMKKQDWIKSLNSYNPAKMVLFRHGSIAQRPNKVPYFKEISWGSEKISKSMTDSWLAHSKGKSRDPSFDSFKLPPRTLVMPSRFNIRPPTSIASKVPIRLRTPSLDGKAHVYWKQDTKRNIPITQIAVRISSPLLTNSAKNQALVEWYSYLILKSLDKRLGNMSDVGMEVNIYPDVIPGALNLTLQMYSDKIRDTIGILGKIIGEGNGFSQLDCEAAKTKASIDLMPDTCVSQNAVLRLEEFLSNPELSQSRKREMIRACTLQDLEALFGVKYVSEKQATRAFGDASIRPPRKLAPFLKSSFAEILVQGNATDSDAKSLAADVVTCLGIKGGCKPASNTNLRIDLTGPDLNIGDPVRVKVTAYSQMSSDSNAVALEIDLGKVTPDHWAICELIKLYFVAEFELWMRNDEVPLAYSSGVELEDDFGKARLRMSASSRYPLQVLSASIQNFVHKKFGSIARKSERWFKRMRSTMVESLQEGHLTLADEIESNMDMLYSRKLKFNASKVALAAMKTASFKKFKSTIAKYQKFPWVLVEVDSGAPAEPVPEGITVDPSMTEKWTDIGNGHAWKHKHFPEAVAEFATNEFGFSHDFMEQLKFKLRKGASISDLDLFDSAGSPVINSTTRTAGAVGGGSRSRSGMNRSVAPPSASRSRNRSGSSSRTRPAS